MAAPTGIDQSWGYANPSTIARAGVIVVSGYVSWDPSKNWNASDVKAYHATDTVGLLVNWESQAGAPLLGAAQGKADATEAVRLVRALFAAVGYRPHNRLIIYFSCDRDVTSSQWPAIDAYYRAAKAVCAAAGFGIGVYGEASLVTHLHAAGITDAEWQTYAWSGGVLSPDTDFYQYLNGQTYGGASVDFDRVIHPAELGAWWPPGHKLDSITGADVLLSLTDIKAIFNTDNILPAPPDYVAAHPTNKFWTLNYYVQNIALQVRATWKVAATLPTRLAALQASVAALDAKVTALQQTGGVSIEGDIPATLHVGAQK